ncbi:hypothetical protein BC938DRAFT_480865 [Jimgerdemannia flammicorona]|uniref:Uncharacterized protein n=1 Tax=Jimgerdemannia flammicorona TaxID=994334 RepID=A0A433QHI3_9FUNG|nr:hypothetical protein BC938DRAFT_480865 [Jimgerdemannia flammicorona]
MLEISIHQRRIHLHVQRGMYRTHTTAASKRILNVIQVCMSNRRSLLSGLSNSCVRNSCATCMIPSSRIRCVSNVLSVRVSSPAIKPASSGIGSSGFVLAWSLACAPSAIACNTFSASSNCPAFKYAWYRVRYVAESGLTSTSRICCKIGITFFTGSACARISTLKSTTSGINPASIIVRKTRVAPSESPASTWHAIKQEYASCDKGIPRATISLTRRSAIRIDPVWAQRCRRAL